MLGKIRKTIYSHFIVVVLSIIFIIAYKYFVVLHTSYGGIVFIMGAITIVATSVPIAIIGWFKNPVKTVLKSFLIILVVGLLIFVVFGELSLRLPAGAGPLHIATLPAGPLYITAILTGPLYITATWMILPLDVGYIAGKYLNIQFESIVIGWSATLIVWLTMLFNVVPSFCHHYILYPPPKTFIVSPMLLTMPWLLGLLIDRLVLNDR